MSKPYYSYVVSLCIVTLHKTNFNGSNPFICVGPLNVVAAAASSASLWSLGTPDTWSLLIITSAITFVIVVAHQLEWIVMEVTEEEKDPEVQRDGECPGNHNMKEGRKDHSS